MQEHEHTLADHGRPPPDDPPGAGGMIYRFERVHQDAYSDRLRRRAFILAFTTVMLASSAPKVLSSGDWDPAILWSGVLFVPALLFVATILTMRRRSQVRRRGIRLLDPVEPERGPVSPATGG